MGLSAGADDYLTKPFSPGQVLTSLLSNSLRHTGAGGRVAVGAVATPYQIRASQPRICLASCTTRARSRPPST